MKASIRKFFCLLLTMAVLVLSLAACSVSSIQPQKSGDHTKAASAVADKPQITRQSAAGDVSNSMPSVQGVVIDASTNQFVLQSESGRTLTFSRGGMEQLSRYGLVNGRAYKVYYKKKGRSLTARRLVDAQAAYNNPTALEAAGTVLFAVRNASDLDWFSRLCHYPLTVNGTEYRSRDELLAGETVSSLLPEALRASVEGVDLMHTPLKNSTLTLSRTGRAPCMVMRYIGGRWSVTEIQK